MQKTIAGLTHRLKRLEKLEHRSSRRLFEGIIGHEDIKKIISNAIFSKNPVHVLLVGHPGSAKTMFLLQIYRIIKASLFVIGSNTTKAGLLNQLFETKPKFVLVDEIEKMNKPDQSSLLHLMETRQMELKCRVFASANSCEKISEPLLSRFMVLKIPEYTFVQFKEIVVFRLKRENIREGVSIGIAEKLWHELGSKDMRCY